MSEQENVRIVQEAFAAFKRGDIASLLNMLTDDVDWWINGPPEIIPYVGARRGQEQVAQFFATLGETVEFTEFEPEEFIAQADKVVSTGRDRQRIKKTGRTAENTWAMVFTLRDGKIASFRSYEDSAAVAAAFTATMEGSASTGAK